MKFSEAMECLKKGSKVTRKPWKDGVYFFIVGNEVKSFQPRLTVYSYSEDIMVSEGWLVDDGKKEHSFSEIIPLLSLGSTAKLKEWKEMYICYDFTQKALVLHSMDAFPFIPDFDSFSSNDWIEING